MTVAEWLLSIPHTKRNENGWIVINLRHIPEHMGLFVWDGNHIMKTVKAQDYISKDAAVHWAYDSKKSDAMHVLQCYYVKDETHRLYKVGMIAERCIDIELGLLGHKEEADRYIEKLRS